MFDRTIHTDPGWTQTPEPWRFSPAQIALRLFLTCWLVYSLHFSTNIVREIYLALAIGDHLSFRVDDYAHLHPDLFEKDGYGWHIGSNPGVSMLAAVPYMLARPVLDRIVERVQEKRRAQEEGEPPTYNSPWPMARQFYQKAWERGLDIKFGLAAFVMQAFSMAPSSALGVVALFYVLRRIFLSDKIALGLSILYAFGTPVFFRTGYLNHNLMLGHIAFLGFVAMWNPSNSRYLSERVRLFLGGLAGGTAVLFDYSGLVFLLGLFGYAVARSWGAFGFRETAGRLAWYAGGAIGPVVLLWFYQWQSFGSPFFPGQHWMPPVEWIDKGYQGVGFPQLELLTALAFDYRYGLFVTCPLLLLALLWPFVAREKAQVLPKQELVCMVALFAALWVFFGGVNYTRLQFNTGMRYLAPIIPFLFVPASIVLMRMPWKARYFVCLVSFTEAWCLAMYRDVERGLGVLDPILHVFAGGFQLPALTTLSRMGTQYGDLFEHGVSPLPLFVLAAVILYGLWKPGAALAASVEPRASRRMIAKTRPHSEIRL